MSLITDFVEARPRKRNSEIVRELNTRPVLSKETVETVKDKSAGRIEKESALLAILNGPDIRIPAKFIQAASLVFDLREQGIDAGNVSQLRATTYVDVTQETTYGDPLSISILGRLAVIDDVKSARAEIRSRV